MPTALAVIDTADSREGSERLRNWLLTPRPEREVIENRATLVSELKALPRPGRLHASPL